MSDSLVVEMAFCRVMALFTTNSENWKSRKYTLIIALILWIFVGITTGSAIPMTRVKFSEYRNEYILTMSNMYIENECFLFRYTVLFFGIVFGVTPCILNFIFFLMILCKLKAFDNHRKKNLSRMKLSRVDQSSRMLQAVLIMFLTVKTPESLLNIFSALFIIDYYLFIAPKVTEILTALSIINASASFVIYCIMSSHFREVFVRLFVPKRIQRKIHSNETMIVTIVPTGRPTALQ